MASMSDRMPVTEAREDSSPGPISLLLILECWSTIFDISNFEMDNFVGLVTPLEDIINE